MWIWVVLLALLTWFFSLKIVKYSSYLMSSTKLSGLFIGVTMVSIVTSIPELVTQIIQGASGNASTGVSNILGSNAFTILSIGVIWLIMFSRLAKSKVTTDTIILTCITLIISVILTIFLFIGKDLSINIANKTIIGLIPIFIVIFYVSISVYLYYHAKNNVQDGEPSYVKHKTNMAIWKIITCFVAFSIALVICALFLNWAVDASSNIYSIDPKSGGGLLLSVITTLPEVTALVAFVRYGYISAGIASIFGSHIFNFSLFLLADLFYTKGPVFVEQSKDSVWSIGLMISIMISLFLTFILLRKKIKSNFINISFLIGIITTYIIGWILLTIYLG